MTGDATIKKIKPFPIHAQLTDARGTYPGQIKTLAVHGMMIEVAATAVQPGEKVEISFVTPVHNATVGLEGVVIKVYNQISNHLIEVHYRNATADMIGRIARFLAEIGQGKKS